MKSVAPSVFTRRVQTVLGWTLLLGTCASLNVLRHPSADSLTRMDRAAVVPRVVAPSVVSRRAYDRAAPNSTSQERLPAIEPRSEIPWNQSVVTWFTKYDQVRREAQMTRSEKADAVRLWASSYVQTTDRDDEVARAILTRMVVRYDRAAKQLAALPQIPETKVLHKGYLEYFQRAHANFRGYVETLDKKSPRAAFAQMDLGRQPLALFDAGNKSLDRQLRTKYNIAEFKP